MAGILAPFILSQISAPVVYGNICKQDIKNSLFYEANHGR